MKRLLALALTLSLLCAAPVLADVPESSLFVPKIDLPEGFYLGMDVSTVLAEEAAGVRYYDFDGQERDLFAILADNGINLVRVRVWNDPYDEEGRSYGGGNCDVATAVRIAERCRDHGISLMVDFHYSDFWADPSKQMVPKAWKGLSAEEKGERIYAFTADSLRQLKATGADIALVQIGNETNGTFCGETSWRKIVYLMMRPASVAIREVCPEALIAVHFTDPNVPDKYMTYASKLDYYGLDYDVFASSWYPYWHGDAENLAAVLAAVQETYGKKVMVAETSWVWTMEDGDFSGNTIGDGGGYELAYPASVQGQSNEIAAAVRAMASIGGIGVCYWEGAWIPVPGGSYEANSELWERYGAGWASSSSASYDPKDAGLYYGGCSWDNQTVFDFTGHPLESLKTFRLLRTGNTVPLTADTVEQAEVTCDLAGIIALPETVLAVMNDDSRVAVPVVWEAVDEDALRAAGPADYTVSGDAGGIPAVCVLHMRAFNYLADPSFEEGGAAWTVADRAGTEQLCVEEKANDSLAGVRHYHFWSPNANGVDFDLTQTVDGLAAGTYRFQISVMGGDAGEQDIRVWVRVNGEEAGAAQTEITSWNDWHTAAVEGIAVRDGDSVTVGVTVVCRGAGAWGKIDDASLELAE